MSNICSMPGMHLLFQGMIGKVKINGGEANSQSFVEATKFNLNRSCCFGPWIMKARETVFEPRTGSVNFYPQSTSPGFNALLFMYSGAVGNLRLG